jgi:hypothetical protein
MRRTICTATIGVLAALLVPGAASASGDDVRNAGRCSDASSSKIKVKPDDGGIEVEFEVDQNVNGANWKVKIKDNSEIVFQGSATTSAPSGSFSLERRIADRSGPDEVLAVGRNKATGERCTATATI